jgi:hypothetical protein
MDVSKGDVEKAWPEIVKGLSRGDKLKLSKQVERELGRRSTYYLAKNILGYDRLNGKFHLDLCAYHDKYFYENQFHWHPRQHFKTTIITITGNVRHTLCDPNIAIGIMMNSMDNCRAVMQEMKSHYISNDKFKSLYPEHAIQTLREEGTAFTFTTPARTRKQKRTPSLSVFSSDKTIVSLSYDKLHFDDIVDDKNTTSRDLMDKTYSNYANSLVVAKKIRDRENKMVPWHNTVGTRWDYYDPWARIIEDNQQDAACNMLITRAEWNDDDGKHHILFPEEFDQGYLDGLRQKWDDYLYSCLMINDPVPEGAANMSPEKILWFDPETPVGTPLNKCITVDPASSIEGTYGDPTVIAAYTMDPHSNIRNIETEMGQWPLDEIADRICDMVVRTHINKVGIEINSFQKWLKQTLERKMKEKKLYFTIIEIKRSPHERKKGKGGRQERCIGFLNESKIHLPKDDPLWDYKKKELRQWPHGRHDHWLDTLTDAIDILIPPAPISQKAPQYRVPPQVSTSRRGFQTGYSTRSSDHHFEEY